jgi:hypothetical protein
MRAIAERQRAPGRLRRTARTTMPEPARIKVTVTDLGTGDTEEEVISDDYVITCAGDCYVDHVQMYANGTHVLTIKGRKRG